MEINGIRRCIGCMRVLNDDSECPYCHMRAKDYRTPVSCILPGTVLAERYVLGKVLGEGSFGITYLAWDKVLELPVAIKEYYPAELVRKDIVRGTDLSVHVYSENDEDEYKTRLNKFINEARYLTKFDNMPGIVSVRDFFYENNTAYIVMEYVSGDSIKKYIKDNGRMSGKEVLKLMKPILLSLAKIHGRGIIHRDISPDNIIWNEEKGLVLIDFGSARVRSTFNDNNMTVFFKRGYSPAEQYRENGVQAEYSDIYSVCATMYYMLTGTVPLDAVERMAGETLSSIGDMPDIELSYKAKKAIMKGMALKPENRYQKTEQLINALYEDYEVADKGSRLTYKSIIAALAGLAILTGMLLIGRSILSHGKKETTIYYTEPAAAVVTENPQLTTDIPQLNTSEPVQTKRQKNDDFVESID